MEKNSLKTKEEISRLCSLTGNLQRRLDLKYFTSENDRIREMMREASPVEEPVIPLFRLLGEKRNKGKNKEESRCELEIKQSLKEPQANTMIDINPFLYASVNTINLTWVKAEMRPIDTPTEGVIKQLKKPKASIIKGVVLYNKCQCECELKVPEAGAVIDQELIKRRKEEEHENRMSIMRAAERETSRNVFQRLGRDSQPKNLLEVFRNYEALEEVEDKEAKILKWVDVSPSQLGYVGGDVRMK
ncbi:receptor-like protein 12 [Pyrus ussuriensis x Pyrus communis]|uniref:Receptor-like protein 12 n=1 Tax=Pyrus ussuriensis x Pyrus communis TaxID=2448454 RepID=A0A5N5GJJ4_9ROSA|nr:receptor-like protein 12 [Pyrus ussuriensis x Pyrus communis]